MVKAYLQVTMFINDNQRATAQAVYERYKEPSLKTIAGAESKELLVRSEDVEVMHGFDSLENAQAYLKSELFLNKVFPELKLTWSKDPEVKIYEVK